MKTITRRTILKSMAAGITICLTGCGRKIVWPADGSDKGQLRIIFFTDVHARKEWDTPRALQMATQSINSQKADIVIAGGDLITGGFESSAESVAPRWDVYMEMHKNICTDLFPAIGNHDLVAAIPEDGSPPSVKPREVFLEKMCLERTYYSFDALDYHFIVLDSISITGDDFKYNGLIWPEEFDWLQSDLAGLKTATPIIVVTHMPLLTTFYAVDMGSQFKPDPNRVIVNNNDVLNLFQNHNLLLVLQGHLHISEFHFWKNTAFITGGAICGKWWGGAWYGTEEGFNVLTLSKAHVDWEYIDYGWTAKRPVD